MLDIIEKAHFIIPPFLVCFHVHNIHSTYSGVRWHSPEVFSYLPTAQISFDCAASVASRMYIEAALSPTDREGG